MSIIKLPSILLLVIIGVLASSASAANPVLNFTDLITGPDTGLGDGKGSGVIVTVWGQFLGSNQGSSTIEYCDSTAACRPGHVYYWKNADGLLPGGPANLYESHKMHEIAFSIPDSAIGAGTIKVTVNNRTSTLPFTVRSGNIFHVKASGNDSSGDGSFNSPWSTVGKAKGDIAQPGATLYVHDSIVTGDSNTKRPIYWNKVSASSGLADQFVITAYPGSQPSTIGKSGFLNYNTAGQVVSKYKIFASNCDEGANGQPINCVRRKSIGIQTTAFGRAVGNSITDQPGGCASGMQGAISGHSQHGDRVSGYQIFGNEIYEYGCYGSNKLHHTTYLTIRSGNSNTPNLQAPAWRFGWNYLRDNHTKSGIHNYDEGNNCGSPTGTVNINDNVVINQGGAGIFAGSTCGWHNDWEIYNNILINVGLVSDWDGIDVNTTNGPHTSGIIFQDDGLLGNINVYNNSIITWAGDDVVRDAQACLGLLGEGDNLKLNWSNNICVTEKDKPFVDTGYQAESLIDNPVGSNNIWHFTGVNASKAIAPNWDAAKILTDPLLTVKNTVSITVGANSPVINASNSSSSFYDIYGVKRSVNADIGAVEFFLNKAPVKIDEISIKVN